MDSSPPRVGELPDASNAFFICFSLVFQQVSANLPTDQPQHPSSAPTSTLSRQHRFLPLFLGASVLASIDNLRLRGLCLFRFRLDVPQVFSTNQMPNVAHSRLEASQ